MFGGSPWFLGIVLAGLAGVALFDAARNRTTLFDARFTDEDRQRVTRLVLFVLLPMTVLMHEAGHAVAVKAFGGRVVEIGFFLFYGYVAHIGAYTPIERNLIAFAGPLVNIVLGLAAIGAAWAWPRRASLNYLLFVFGVFELGNALVFYPLLDAFGGVAGDWGEIYSRETPLFSALVGVGHVGLLLGAALLWRNPGVKRGYIARTTSVPRTSSDPSIDRASPETGQRQLAGMLTVAAALATNGWRHPVTLLSDEQAGGAQVIVRWQSGGYQRALLVHASLPTDQEQHVEMHAAISAVEAAMPPHERPLARVDGRPTAHELVPYIRRYLDYVESWNGANVVSPN